MVENVKPSEVLVTVCTTCRREGTDPDAQRPGRVLMDKLAAAPLPAGVTVSGVECLSSCTRGCAMVLSGGSERWTYVYGDMDPDTHVEEILEGLKAYANTDDGLVPWRERPQSFRKQTVARIPPIKRPEA